ncbi:phage tail protein [Marinomonas aquiplantarum]|uniref:Tail protein P2 I n=1 Tax=Marinomonas aquiplantarum TaxID=491951 RepID=A0A366D072_9GAMM|nr:phage tail protein [Marinomonas aquiplantarum]RBO83441.1 tail protein P2 I [Marinomonas aquiplantarum]
MEKYSLPVWMRQGEKAKALKAAFDAWWGKVEKWLQVPLDQMDAETCHSALLKYLAFQKDVKRFSNEPEELFRKRVKFAEQNAMDAGSKAGFIAIFERLGIGFLEMKEREDAESWDVISLRLSDSQIASNIDLLSYIIQQYGRTCRRYELTVLTPVELGVSVIEVGYSWHLDVAKQVVEPWGAQVILKDIDIGHSWNLDVASI